MAYESSRDIMTVNVGFEVTEPRFSSGSTTLAIIAVLYKNNVSTVKLGKSDTRVALGDGATSTVFKTRFEEKDWEYHEALVAVKQKKRQGSYMTQDFSLDNWLRCCLNDLRIGSHPKLGSHPNIMEVLAICWEYYEHNDVRSCSPCLVLRLSELGPLSKFVRSVPYLPEASLIQHCADVLDGLKALHHYQVVHGDIKMENILLFKDHRGEVRAKISDFSHSIFLDDNFDGNTTYIGTRPFYVPEIRKQQAAMRTTGRADTVENLPACDIYASGILFWTLLTQGNDVANTIATLSPCHLIDRDVEDILEALGEDGLLQLCMRDLAEGILLPTTQIGRISQKALTVFRNVFHSSLADDTTVRGSAASLLNLFNSLLRVEDAVAVNR
jgi:serine/threonine protein kinase